MPGPKVILLMGATATGKTDLALEIAAFPDVEIISVDSALIYRGHGYRYCQTRPRSPRFSAASS